MTFREFIAHKVRRGEMRPATAAELAEKKCSGGWHYLPEEVRCGTCPQCGQKLKGWYYEA